MREVLTGGGFRGMVSRGLSWRLTQRMVTGGEFSCFGDFSCCVEVFRGVDVVEADTARVGSFEVFVGEDCDWRVVGSSGFFDDSAWG